MKYEPLAVVRVRVGDDVFSVRLSRKHEAIAVFDGFVFCHKPVFHSQEKAREIVNKLYNSKLRGDFSEIWTVLVNPKDDIEAGLIKER